MSQIFLPPVAAKLLDFWNMNHAFSVLRTFCVCHTFSVLRSNDLTFGDWGCAKAPGIQEKTRRRVTTPFLQRPRVATVRLFGSILSGRRQWAVETSSVGDRVWALLQYGGNPYLRPSSTVTYYRI